MQELTWSSTNKKIYSSRWLLREAQKNCNTYDLKNYHTPNKQKRRWARLRGTKNSYVVIAVLNLAKHLTTTYYQPWPSMLTLWLHWYDRNKIWCILHPAGRQHSHLDSLRSTTIQPCTRFAGIPEASSHSAFSLGFSFFPCIFLGGQCSTEQQAT